MMNQKNDAIMFIYFEFINKILGLILIFYCKN